MNKQYLGEFPVNVATHPIYSKYTPIDWAMLFIGKYGQIDGAHHKTWVLDQVARILKGTPVIVLQAQWSTGLTEDRFQTSETVSDEYVKWANLMRYNNQDKNDCVYDYDAGIAP